MQKQLQRLAAGKFDDMPVELTVDVEKIELSVLENAPAQGVIHLESSQNIPVRGVVYSSNPRVKIQNPSFSGDFAEIHYSFDSSGLKEGDIETGAIYIICLGREFTIDFSAVITKAYYESENGCIRTLSQFFELAQEGYYEAFSLFQSPEFLHLFRRENDREKLYYQGLTKNRITMQEYDEFLVACGEKQRMKFSLPKEDGYYENVQTTRKECIQLQKEGFGYIEIEAFSDSDFVSIEKKTIHEEDFVGSRYEMPLYIHGDKLHVGKNFAKITFSTAFETCVFTVCATRLSGKKKEQEKKSARQLRAELTRLYIDYRLNKNITGVFTKETLLRLEQLREYEPKNERLLLFKAQTLLINKQRQDALWTLEEFKENYTLENPEIHAYYNYILTLLNKDVDFVREKADEIKRIYNRHPESYVILWTSLFLNEDLAHSKTRKLAAIREQILRGNPTPILFLEANYLYSQDPMLINSLDRFEMKCLLWAVRHGCVSRGMALQTAKMVVTGKTNPPHMYRVLSYMASLYPEQEVINAICTFLVRNSMYGPEYYEWYRLGLRMELRITLLNEYYLMSVPEMTEETCPKPLQLYFAYNCQLPDKTAAKLFAFIIKNKEKEPAVYQGYRKYIDEFALRALERKSIFPDMTLVYEDFLDHNLITKEIAECFCQVLFAKRFHLHAKGPLKKFIILSGELEGEQVALIQNQEAILSLSSTHAAYLYEDAKGHRYAAADDFQRTNLFASYKYAKTMLSILPSNVNCLIDYMDRKGNLTMVTREDMSKIYMLMVADGIRQEYKLTLLPVMYEYLQNNLTEDFLKDYLRKTDLNDLSPREKGKAAEVYIMKGQADKAYEVVERYGDRFISPVKLVTLCSERIESTEYAYDPTLVEIAENLLLQNRENAVIIKYLLQHYTGATKNMATIWKRAKDSEDVFELAEFEERILTQMLFTTNYLGCMEEVFASYSEKNPSTLVSQAYSSYCAYGYFVGDNPIGDALFESMVEKYRQKEYLNDICLLALFKYLVLSGTEDVERATIEAELLANCCSEGLEFDFYDKLERSLKVSHNLHDKIFIGYYGKPGDRVALHYMYDYENGDSYHEIPLKHQLYGIYVVHLPLFFGESLQYYLTVEADNGYQQMIESGAKGRKDVYYRSGHNRFDLINNSIVAMTLNEQEAALGYVEQYLNRDYIAGRIFKIL